MIIKIKFQDKMKKSIYSIIFCTIASVAFGQVSIGGNQSVNGNSTILDFAGGTATESSADQATTNEKGIILPAVGSSPTYTVVSPTTNNPNNGTFVFDRNLKKVRMYENGTWKDLSDGTGNDIPSAMVNASNEVGKGVIIGAQSSSAKGVLVLESTNKAMILPHIKNPHTTVKSPYPGMMCYDTVSNSLAVYDGTRWNYWK